MVQCPRILGFAVNFVLVRDLPENSFLLSKVNKFYPLLQASTFQASAPLVKKLPNNKKLLIAPGILPYIVLGRVGKLSNG